LTFNEFVISVLDRFVLVLRRLRGYVTLADHPPLLVGGDLSRYIDRARARSGDPAA
jgi:hypothetical protein